MVLTHDHPDWGIYINGEKVLTHVDEAARNAGRRHANQAGNNASYQCFDGGFYSIRISDSICFQADETFEQHPGRIQHDSTERQNPGLGSWDQSWEVTFREGGDGVRYQVLLDHSAHAHDIRVKTAPGAKPALDSIKDIRCEARDSVDHDGDFFSYLFEWSVDGTDIFAHPVNDRTQDVWAEQIPDFSKISCTVQATDAADTSEPVTESFIQ